MNRTKRLADRIVCVACALVVGVLAGCVGVEGSVGVDTYVPGPDVVVFGGYGHWHHFDRDAGRRGAVSRAAAGHRR